MARQEIDLTTPQPNGKMGEPTKSAWEKVNDMTLEIYDAIESGSDRGLINGFHLFWGSATSLSVSSGIAFIEGDNTIVSLDSDVTKSLTGLSANTWYYVYLFVSESGPDIEVVTTGASGITWGTARTKSGDTSRRYLGAIRTTTGGAIVQFQHFPQDGTITYLGANYSIRNVLSAGVSTSAATVNLSNIVPPFAAAADIGLSNGATSGTLITGNSTQGLPLAAGAGNSYYGYAGPGQNVNIAFHPLDFNRSIQYRYLSAPSGSGAYIDVNGYRYMR